MTAKEKALEDIQDDLMHQGKCFIQYIEELDETMKELEENYIKEQIKANEK